MAITADPARAATLARILAFQVEFARRQATRIIDAPGGFAVLNDEAPVSYEHNRLLVTGPVDPGAVLAAADQILGGSGLAHRQVSVHDDALGQAFVEPFADAGYEHERDLLMTYSGVAPDRPADPDVLVETADLVEIRAAQERSWRYSLPAAADDAIAQLADRGRLRTKAADVTFLGVRDSAGELRATADLYVADGVGQIENVFTEEDFRGRGYARALVLDGVRRAYDAGCELVFLEAHEDDWPWDLYRRLGFAITGRVHAFNRPPAGTPEAAADTRTDRSATS